MVIVNSKVQHLTMGKDKLQVYKFTQNMLLCKYIYKINIVLCQYKQTVRLTMKDLKTKYGPEINAIKSLSINVIKNIYAN